MRQSRSPRWFIRGIWRVHADALISSDPIIKFTGIRHASLSNGCLMIALPRCSRLGANYILLRFGGRHCGGLGRICPSWNGNHRVSNQKTKLLHLGRKYTVLILSRSQQAQQQAAAQQARTPSSNAAPGERCSGWSMAALSLGDRGDAGRGRRSARRWICGAAFARAEEEAVNSNLNRCSMRSKTMLAK